MLKYLLEKEKTSLTQISQEQPTTTLQVLIADVHQSDQNNTMNSTNEQPILKQSH